MTASSVPANDKKVDEATKPAVSTADTNNEGEDHDGEGAEQKKDKLNVEGVQAAYTQEADRTKVATDGTNAPSCPTANITSDAITFNPPEEKKEGGFLGFVKGVAKGAWDGLTSVCKGIYDAAAGVVNSALDGVWKKEFGSDAQAKVEEKDGKVTKLTATDGQGRDSRVIQSDGKVTSVADSRGNTTYYDSTTGQTYMTDKDGGKYTTDAKTGDSTYQAKDGSKIIQHKDGKREFFDKSGNRMEQGDHTLTKNFDNLTRQITDKGVIDTVKGYHDGAIKVFNHGDVPASSVPAAERNQPGVHQFGDQTEKVESDGFRTIQGKDGRTRFGHCRDGREWEVKQGADGKPEFWRNGHKVNISDMPEGMRKRFEAWRNGTREAKVDGVTQVQVNTTPDGKPSTTVGDVTITATPTGIKTDVQTGPKPGDKATYTNENDGKQTGPGPDNTRFVYDTHNKENPYSEVTPEGKTVFTYNAETNRLWTPEFTSTPEGVQLANGNFIHRDGSVSNADGRVVLNSAGYSQTSPEYQSASAQVIMAVNNTNGVIGMAKSDPKGMSEGAIEGCISDLGKALAQCIKTGNYDRINQIFGAIADAYGALADVRMAKSAEQQKQYTMQNLEDDYERTRAQNRVA